MADQIQSLKDLAKLISGDVTEKLGLSSDSSVLRLLMKELQALSSSNNFLARIVEKKEEKPASQPPPQAESKIDVSRTSSSIAPSPELPQQAEPEFDISKLPSVFSASLKSAIGDLLKSQATANAEAPTNEPKSELEKVEKPKDVRIIGFDEQAIKALGLSEILGKPVDNLVKTLGGFKKGFEGIAKGFADAKNGEGLLSSLLPAGILPILGGAVAILGGVGALVAAFNSDTEAKGTLEAIGKGGLKGGLLVIAKKLFGASIKTVLKKIPIIGTIISYGFAWQRFSKGDTFGGIVDLISGTVQLLDIVAPGLGTILSTGVDVFQAVMDHKGGGSSAEASGKKTGFLMGWIKTIKDDVVTKIKELPVIGDFIKIGGFLADGKNEQALEELTKMIPALHWIKTIVRSKTALTVAGATLTTAGNILTVMGDWMSEKITKVFSPILSFFTKNEKSALAEAEKLGEKVIPKAKGILTPIKDAIIGFGSKILTHLKTIFSPLINVFEQLGEDLVKKGNWIFGKAKGLLTPIGEGIEKLGRSLTGHLRNVFNPVKNFFLDIGENILKKGTWLLDKAKGLLNPLGEGIEKLGKTLTEHLQSVFNPVKNFFLDIGNSILKKGSGILDSAKGLLSPLTEGIEKLGKTVLENLDKMFTPIKTFVKDVVKNLSARASSFIAPITEIVEKIGSRLFSIGDKVFKVFKGTFTSMFSAAAGATVEGVAGKSLLGKLAGFLPKFLGKMTSFLKKVPFIGSIISIGSLGARLMGSDGPDYVGAAIEALSIISGIFLPGTGISLGLDILNGILDSKAEAGEDGKKKSKLDILGKWASDAGDWLYEKLVKVPYIGPMIEVGKLIATDPIGALKALGDTFPVLGSVVNMFESTFPSLFQGDTSSVGFTDIGLEIAKWAYNKVKDWPVVGPLVRAFATFASDPIGVLKTLGTSFPIVNKILSFFDIKSEKTAAGLVFAENVSSASFNFSTVFDRFGTWVWEKILNFPIIGTLLKGLQEFAGDPIGVLRGLGESIPVIKNMLSFFDTKTELKLPDISFQFKNPFNELNDKVTKKVKDWWDKATGAISELNPFKDKEKEISIPKANTEVKKEEEKNVASPTESNSTLAPPLGNQSSPQSSIQVPSRRGGQITPAAPPQNKGVTGKFGDGVIDPNGGLLVSSPKAGSLYQLNKQDSVVAAPMVENKFKTSTTPSFGKAEAILERIAANTATSNQNISNLITGFNNLAKALEKTLGESAKIPVVVNNGSNQGPMQPSVYQYANAGNDTISSFRALTVEGARFRPA